MTNHDICVAAIKLAGETAPEDCPDYLTRSSAILALVFTECAALDASYREAHGKEESGWTPCVSVDLSAAFPLSEIFSAPVTYALAALLVVDENDELSGTLFTRFAALMNEIRRGISAKSVPITDRYRMF